jgi:hypothetical protein
MKVIQKNNNVLLAICLAAALFSCNNAEPKKEAEKEMDSAVATTTAPTPVPAAFTPFDIEEITHTVKDYATWRPVFNADSTARKASGMQDIVVGRGLDKNNNIMVALQIADVAKAKAFSTDPRLKAAMEKGGVISKPGVDFFHVLRFNPDSKEKQWVVVTHKVKDFDAWVKGFDAEGSATRASSGLIDVLLARGIDDSSIVHIVFDIKDMAKAKARMSSPDLKKIMMDAGVLGVPKIEFYTTAE